MANPVLIEVTRGEIVESVHTGALAVADASGDIVLGVGNIVRPVFPRSSIKSLQALPLIESGAADHYNFTDTEIALACASHTGTALHADLANTMLEKLGLGEAALGCGAHTPLGASAAKELWRSGGTPTQLHNNCSGKHVGMLATALHLGEPIADYWQAGHPVQMRVHETLCEVTGLELGPETLGLDGCSVPNWAMPLSQMASMFARLVTGSGLNEKRKDAFQRIMQACWKAPEMIAGRGRADTVVMAKAPGRVFMKTGAEGVYCGGFPDLGLGFALKIDDGTTRASAGTAMTVIEHLIPDARGLMHRDVIKTWRGLEAGRIRTAPALTDALATLKVRG